MNMAQTEADILNDLHELGDTMAQFSYLIECAGECLDFDESLHSDANLIRDCAVKTWLAVVHQGDQMKLVGDSESVLVRGAIALLEELFNDRPKEEVASYECHLLDDEMFVKHFSPKQRKGLAVAIAEAKLIMVESQTVEKRRF